ncbi:unnamed protein product [Ectocarpus sp. CCAP 1310/34]|nr:unnamed protein product [Ectocarpus sp. CCAP 1310/34]
MVCRLLLFALLLVRRVREDDAACIAPPRWQTKVRPRLAAVATRGHSTCSSRRTRIRVRRGVQTLRSAAENRAADPANTVGEPSSSSSSSSTSPQAGVPTRRRTEGVGVREIEDGRPLPPLGVPARIAGVNPALVPLPSPPTRAPRVYLNGANLHVGQTVQLTPEQTRYLVSVMRLRDGSPVRVFDGVNGEFLAAVATSSSTSSSSRLERSGEKIGSGRGGRRGRGKRSTVGADKVVELRVECLTRRQPGIGGGGDGEVEDVDAPEIELVFAPIRKQRLKMLVEKAVEVGASRLTPVLTARTQKGAVSDASMLDRLGAVTAVEAAEQCERMTVPPVASPVTLASYLRSLELRQSSCDLSSIIGLARDRGGDLSLPDIVFVCKERDVDAPPLLEALAEYEQAFSEERRQDHVNSSDGSRNANAAFLIGPEGGFDPDEIGALAQYPFVRFVSLGRTVLRAETAAVYALSSWSAFWASR